MTTKNESAFAYFSGDEKRDIPGLTKREYFAAMAMQGLLASKVELENIGAAAVLYADELLKELEK